jgi:esterase/lipase
MIKQKFLIDYMPAILWGEKSSKLWVAVHGNCSSKDDVPIEILAQEAEQKGYQVLSFDLPEHGDRKTDPTACKVQTCVKELRIIMRYAKTIAEEISLFACSMGAYFSLLSYQNEPIKQSLFLSPVVNMERIIQHLMTCFDVREERLKAEKEIQTPIGQTLYWDYYCYVQEHPIVRWNVPTDILYGRKDDLCDYDVISSFAKDFSCKLELMEEGEHYFHTPEQLAFFRSWVKQHIYK